jgi:pimeloyl-ACP methyl ester carboxylesterase
MSRIRSLSPFTIFVLVLLAGLTLVTVLFRKAQTDAMFRKTRSAGAAPADATKGRSPAMSAPSGVSGAQSTVTDAQKLYLESNTGASELLFNLAFASLSALLALQYSEKRPVRLSAFGVFAASGLLLTSIYAAMLFRFGVSHCLEANLSDIFSTVLSYPILCQFWFLFSAIAVIAASLLRPSRYGMLALVLAAAAVSGPSVAAAPTIAPCVAAGPTLGPCVEAWATSRGLQLTTKAISDADTVIRRVADKEKVRLEDTNRCAFSESVLDAIRSIALRDGHEAKGGAGGTAVAALLIDARASLEASTVSAGELVDRLLSIAEIWTVASGVLEIHAERILSVTVTAAGKTREQWNGYTPRWLLRLPPGSYDLIASDDGGTRVYRGRVTVKDGERIGVGVGAAK